MNASLRRLRSARRLAHNWSCALLTAALLQPPRWMRSTSPRSSRSRSQVGCRYPSSAADAESSLDRRIDGLEAELARLRAQRRRSAAAQTAQKGRALLRRAAITAVVTSVDVDPAQAEGGGLAREQRPCAGGGARGGAGARRRGRGLRARRGRRRRWPHGRRARARARAQTPPRAALHTPVAAHRAVYRHRVRRAAGLVLLRRRLRRAGGGGGAHERAAGAAAARDGRSGGRLPAVLPGGARAAAAAHDAALGSRRSAGGAPRQGPNLHCLGRARFSPNLRARAGRGASGSSRSPSPTCSATRSSRTTAAHAAGGWRAACGRCWRRVRRSGCGGGCCSRCRRFGTRPPSCPRPLLILCRLGICWPANSSPFFEQASAEPSNFS